MKIFVISLKDCIYRRERMQKILSTANIDFEFIDAVKGADLTDKSISDSGLQLNLLLSRSEIGCLLSHVDAWKKLINSDDETALILEDDVHLGKSFKRVLRDINVPQDGLALFRLETMLASVNADLKFFLKIDDIYIYRIYSKHAGTAGYMLNKVTATHLLSQIGSMRNAIDTEMFDPERRKIIGVSVYQCAPAPIIQDGLLPVHQRNPMLTSIIGKGTMDDKLKVKRRVNGLTKKLLDLGRPLYLRIVSLGLYLKGKKRLRIEFDGN